MTSLKGAEILDVVDRLLAGEMTREQASRWAGPLHNGESSDEVIEEALDLLTLIDAWQIDVDGNRTGYLYDFADLEAARSRLASIFGPEAANTAADARSGPEPDAHPMMDPQALVTPVAELIQAEIEDDFLGFWVLPWHIRRVLPDGSDEAVRFVAKAVLDLLLDRATAIGTLDETTGQFEPWGDGEAAARAMSAWDRLGRDPNVGEVAWLARIDREP